MNLILLWFDFKCFYNDTKYYLKSWNFQINAVATKYKSGTFHMLGNMHKNWIYIKKL